MFLNLADATAQRTQRKERDRPASHTTLIFGPILATYCWLHNPDHGWLHSTGQRQATAPLYRFSGIWVCTVFIFMGSSAFEMFPTFLSAFRPLGLELCLKEFLLPFRQNHPPRGSAALATPEGERA
jgi:hypothetical protein